jgi:hypothetical protein
MDEDAACKHSFVRPVPLPEVRNFAGVSMISQQAYESAAQSEVLMSIGTSYGSSISEGPRVAKRIKRALPDTQTHTAPGSPESCSSQVSPLETSFNLGEKRPWQSSSSSSSSASASSSAHSTPDPESKRLTLLAAGAAAGVHQQAPRRRSSDLQEYEKWHCPFGCGKFYRTTSTKSVHAHRLSCTFRPDFKQLALDHMLLKNKIAVLVQRMDDVRSGVSSELVKAVGPMNFTDANVFATSLSSSCRLEVLSNSPASPVYSSPPSTNQVVVSVLEQQHAALQAHLIEMERVLNLDPSTADKRRVAGRKQRPRRSRGDLSEHEKWHCPYADCTMFYKKTSTKSISNHLRRCALAPSGDELGIDELKHLRRQGMRHEKSPMI